VGKWMFKVPLRDLFLPSGVSGGALINDYII
jgi:hypothetical protein